MLAGALKQLEDKVRTTRQFFDALDPTIDPAMHMLSFFKDTKWYAEHARGMCANFVGVNVYRPNPNRAKR